MRRAAARKAVSLPDLASHVERLGHYTSAMRRSMTTGHRLNFNADDILRDIQAACACLNLLLRRRESPGDRQDDDLASVSALLTAIENVASALRDKAVFGPL